MLRYLWYAKEYILLDFIPRKIVIPIFLLLLTLMVVQQYKMHRQNQPPIRVQETPY